MKTVNEIVAMVMESFGDDTNAYVKSEAIKEVVKALNDEKKKLADDAKKLEKAAKQEIAEKNKEKRSAENEGAKGVVQETFKVGDEITWKLSNGKTFTGTIAKFNDKTIRVIRSDSTGYKVADDGNSYANVSYASVQIEVADEAADEEIA